MAVLLPQVVEYEVVDGSELALTLLRSIGLISRNEHPWREEPAGPEVAVPDAQLIGPVAASFALLPHAGSWSDSAVIGEAERFQHPFVTAPGTGDSATPRKEPGLEVVGEGVVLSSLRRRGDWLEARLVCEHPEGRTAVIRGAFRETRDADLRGRPGAALEVVDGELAVPLRAWEIRSIQLR
jgi:alpha-mannosidase